jgi:hypothetical protein
LRWRQWIAEVREEKIYFGAEKMRCLKKATYNKTCKKLFSWGWMVDKLAHLINHRKKVTHINL